MINAWFWKVTDKAILQHAVLVEEKETSEILSKQGVPTALWILADILLLCVSLCTAPQECRETRQRTAICLSVLTIIVNNYLINLTQFHLIAFCCLKAAMHHQCTWRQLIFTRKHNKRWVSLSEIRWELFKRHIWWSKFHRVILTSSWWDLTAALLHTFENILPSVKVPLSVHECVNWATDLRSG